jgi:SPP1 gp7 family putative phage head morphogenesis protein
MLKKDWAQLNVAAQRKAFTAADIAQLDMVAQVFRDVQVSMAKGESLDDFKKRATEKLVRAWGGSEIPGRVENIYRTNLQTAYGQGRHHQLTDPAVLSIRPYWEYVAVLDHRTSEFCKPPVHGTILPANHPWWRKHNPPLHYQCRACKRALSREQAANLGIDARGPVIPAQEGFGTTDGDWTPDLRDYPESLRKAFKRRNRKG